MNEEVIVPIMCISLILNIILGVVCISMSAEEQESLELINSYEELSHEYCEYSNKLIEYSNILNDGRFEDIDYLDCYPLLFPS